MQNNKNKTHMSKATALSQGAHELGLVLWDALAQIAHAPREPSFYASGRALGIPRSGATTVVGLESTASCAAVARALSEGGHRPRSGASADSLACALRFGAQGVDALRAAFILDGQHVLPQSAFGSSTAALRVNSVGFS